MLTREVLRAIRQIVGAVELAGMDVVEVSPPYDHAETTAMAANRAALEAISALAVRKAAGGTRALGAGQRVDRTGRSGHRQRARAPVRPRPRRTIRATSTCTGRSPTAPTAPSSSWPPGPAGWPSRWPCAGHRVTGVDLDPAMLRPRAERATAEGLDDDRLEFVEADLLAMSGSRTPARYAFAFIALNSIMLLASRAAQRSGDPDARRPPRAGRLAAVDAWLPDADDLGRFDGRLILEWIRADPATGALVTKSGSAIHDAATGTIVLTAIFEEATQGEAAPPLDPPGPAAARLAPTS